MKSISLLLLVVICGLSACNGQQKSNAKKTSDEIQAVRKEHTPGSISTSPAGYYMKCKIDGKDWVADSMMPVDPTGRILGQYNKDYISFPYNRRDMVPGKKIKISATHAVDFVNSSDGICGGTKGEMNITKVDDNWAEGNFSFTVTGCVNDPNKRIEVTGGFFRVSIKRAP